jgi:acyl transferase domain-containing protein/NADPH:quinone reductase-like Zn-dependent oxidoreductase/SAM-dependent methyltransferase/acyl carrier protein
MEKDAIAIIGVGCRFPGSVNDTDGLWELLVKGREAVKEVPTDRWNVERFYDSEPGLAGKSIAMRGGFLDGIDQFDPQFFGISPREAPYVDPQHRLLLETAWESIENAGLVLDFERGSDLAVFVGISHNDYQGIQGTSWDHSGITAHSPTGSAHSIAANRISYCLNLRGPSLAVDTACSSSLAAVHLACEQIRSGRVKTALAGGVTVMITPGGFIGFSQASMLSPDGRCKAFDASADGFVRGEGAAMVILKRLSDALADGDPIRGVILGTAMNQDGHTNGISLPSPEAQARLAIEACADAGISPSQVGFVEAHGTGTAVGDPIEAHALSEAFCSERPEEAPLIIGSIKTNLGHLETAAGMAGLLKAMLVLEHREIPGSLHFKTPNPHIDLEKLKLRIPVEVEPFPATNGPRLAGVNSFGFGGANAHVVLAEPPQTAAIEISMESASQRDWPIVLSARSEASLRASAGRLAAWIDDHMRSNGHSPLLPDLAYTLGARRNHHSHRLTAVVRTHDDLVQALNEFAAGQPTQALRSGFTPRREQAPRIGFVMSGQGPQWWAMGRELMQHERVFRETIERCDASMRPWARFGLIEEMSRDESESQMHRTEIAQPAIFAMQVALSKLWESWGITPSAIVGHSVGEIAAACVAGILDIETAARVIVLRARAMENCARGEGTMLAVGITEEDAASLILRVDRTVKIAAFNSPRLLTLSGAKSSLETIAAELASREAFARFVKVDHPFHHPKMEPAAAALEAELADLDPREETVPFFSTVTGTRCLGTDCDAAHWGQGIRQPVQFASAVAEMAHFGVDLWLEIGAHPALTIAIQECLAASETKAPVIASTRREHEHASLLESALELHRHDVPIDFQGMTPSRNMLTLPAYAWDKARWWNESDEWRDGRLAPGGRGLLDVRLPRATPIWTARLDGRHMAFLKDHKVESRVIFPAAAFVDMAIEAAIQLFEGRPFVIEDFEIRRPLLVPDPPSSLQLEMSYDADTRTFVIQSRQGAAWTQHVVGSLRAERTDSAFSASRWQPEGELNEIDVPEYYAHLSDLGLRYGEEFRPISELSASNGRSAGRVALSEAIARRAAEYPMHPVLFDGAMQIFSAGAATVEGRRSRMKLPVRFSRIQFLRSPGASSRVTATVRNFTDDLVEGDIALYDHNGYPAVLVEGFRAVGLAAARRMGLSGGRRDLIYHVEWERTRAGESHRPLPPIPLSKLREAAEHAFNDVLAIRGRDRVQAALAAEDTLAVAQITAALRKMAGAGDLSASSLGIVPAMQPAFERLMNALEQNGMVSREGEAWRPTAAFTSTALSESTALRDFLASYPGHLPEALLCATTSGDLGPILRGEKDAVQTLFSGAGSDLLDHFYGDGLSTSHWLAAISEAVLEIERQLPTGRGLRILEVGGGTAGLAAYLLPRLERDLHSYTFTDVSTAFFSGASQKLANFPEVECRVLDLEISPAEQGFDEGSFDIVLGANVLHAVADLRASLGHIHSLLAPGGTALFLDTATPQLWTDSVFGLTSGWWRFRDRELRPNHPLLQRSQWERIFRQAGFTETDSLAGLHGRDGEGQIGLFAQKAISEEAAADGMPSDPPNGKSWLILADAGGMGDALARRLAESGAECMVAHKGEKPIDWREVLANRLPDRIIWLWSLDATIAEGSLMGTDDLLALTQALEDVAPSAKLRIDLVTQGAQEPGGRPLSVAQAPLIGFFRVVLSEHPNLVCRSTDLCADSTCSAGVDALWEELRREDSEREVALRGEARYVQRIARGIPERRQRLDASVPMRMTSRDPGVLDAVRFDAVTQPTCGPGEVLIDVKAAGVNFRDVLKALALYPADAPDARLFGDEVAGTVIAVGPGVDHVAIGDDVFGIAVAGLATHSLARGGDVRRIPHLLSYEEAATIPVAFMTAWHSLKHVARLRAGERVLIHAGAGGVGMAAVQIARYLGAEVIASAGSPVKRELLITMGVNHVVDSRRGDFAAEVMAITSGKGVDVILNSLAGEAIPMGLSCLAEFGRFIEIGKRDIYQNSRIPLWPMRRNVSFHVVAMDAVFNRDADLTRQLLGDVATLIEEKSLRPLPYRSFPACRADAAFRLMAQGRHIGKIVIAFAKPFISRWGKRPPRPFQIKEDGAYLITGAFGGFGRVIARWLADGGAKHLVLLGRNGAATPEAEALVGELTSRGVDVVVEQADVGSAADMKRVLGGVRNSGCPLRGIFHLAMVIDDAPIAALTPDRVRSVLNPKAHGAWILHEETLGMDLDCFVMFSSVSSIFGNPAQGNYAAANAFLDALAHHRRAAGLPALAINWGVLGGEGYVARNERVAEFLARQGTSALSPGEVISILEEFLAADVGQAAAIRVDWAKWRQSFRGMQENPLVEKIFASVVEEQESGRPGDDWRDRISAAAPEEREEIVGQAIRAIISSVLRVKPESLRADQPLTDLGLDSLMGAEIETSIESAIGVGLPSTTLMRARTIGQIQALIAAQLNGAAAPAPASATPPAATPIAAPAAVEGVDFESLSDEDIDLLIEEPSTESHERVSENANDR